MTLSLGFIVNHLPNLTDRNQLAVYSLYCYFSSSKGEVELTNEQIMEHLKLTNPQLTEANRGLITANLIYVENNVIKCNLNLQSKVVDSELGKKWLNDFVPTEHQVLLNQQKLYECYTINGVLLWKVLATISKYFNIDHKITLRLMENPIFKQKFIEVREAVEKAAEISGAKVTKRKLKKPSDKTVTELYQQLMDEVHLRDEHLIPQAEWKSPQLLRYYCLAYKKHYQADYVFTTNPFGSLEMREAKKLLDAFDGVSEDVVTYIDWCFANKTDNAKYPLSIRFCSHDGVIREYRTRSLQTATTAKKTPTGSSSLLPTEFIEWIVKHYPKIQNSYHLSKIENLVWLKKAMNENGLPDPDLKYVVEHAIKLRLIPA